MDVLKAGVKMAPRETENNAYAKFWGDKQRALWYIMVFSGVVNTRPCSNLGGTTLNEREKGGGQTCD